MTKCALEGCNREARRRFCCNKHKDRYHNIHNPRGKFAHLNIKNIDAQDEIDFYHDSIHPFSSEAFDDY